MDYIVRLVLIAITAALVNNFVLVKFLGICPFLGVSSKLKPAIGMGVAVSFVMGMASAMSWMVQHWILNPLGIGFLQTIAFILVIAALVQFVEMVLKKTNQTLYKALGVYLPLITTNCAVLGVAILNIDNGYDFIQSVVAGVFGGVGFTIAIILMAGVREKLENAQIPEAMKGFPITLVAAGLMAIAFMGFAGLGG